MIEALIDYVSNAIGAGIASDIDTRLRMESERIFDDINNTIRFRPRQGYVSDYLLRCFILESLLINADRYKDCIVGFRNATTHIDGLDGLSEESVGLLSIDDKELATIDPTKIIIVAHQFMAVLGECGYSLDSDDTICHEVNQVFSRSLLLGSIVLPEPIPVYAIAPDLFRSLSQTATPERMPDVNMFASRGFILPPGAESAIYFQNLPDTGQIAIAIWSKQLGFCFRMISFDNISNNGTAFEYIQENFVDNMEDVRGHQNLFVNLVYLLAQQPDLIEIKKGAIAPSNTVKGFGSNKPKRSVKLNAPIMIGGNYRIKKEYTPRGGTHSSPVTHWRRGHWRNQSVGPKNNRSSKNIWIEPILVNA